MTESGVPTSAKPRDFPKTYELASRLAPRTLGREIASLADDSPTKSGTLPPMLDTGEALWLIMGALALGVTIPVLVQLFLTLRKLHHTIGEFAPTLRLLNQLAERQSDIQSHAHHAMGPQLPAIIAALVPALVAGYQAFSHQRAEYAHASARESSHNSTLDSHGES